MTAAATEPAAVAITGMACLFPGCPDLDAYWRNIIDKVDCISDPAPESWDPEVYYDPHFADTDRTYCRRGGYLGRLASFDPLPFGIPPAAVGGEPDQWLALQVAHDALRDAGADDLPAEVRARTAIILGKGTYLNGGNAIAVQRGLVVGQTIDLIRRLHPEHSAAELERLRAELQAVLPPLNADTVPGLIPNIIVGRIANRLDLMGAAYTVDAACASSLVAVGHAVRDLLAGDCDVALAGGSQVWMPVATLNLFCRLGALSRRQQLRPFDRDADGTLLGEGIGMVVLKRLSDARGDGDRIYAVIRGVGVSSDGRGAGVMAPRVEGEELALHRAYAAAGVSPATVGLVEAHGTGTPVGDATEVRSLTRVFGERQEGLPRCALGTVKSMISHTIPAAGVAGLIKTALALHHRVLPPTLHCEEPNPALELERTPFYINTETRPWIHGGREPRRAGINAFGFGGINAHAVLEEIDGGGRPDHRPPWPTEVCILEAESAAALAARARELGDALEAEPEYALADLARTLASELGAVDGPRRLAIVASSLGDLRDKLALAVDKLQRADRRVNMASGIHYEPEPLGRTGKLAFVFPGEGAQYPHMLSDLCQAFPDARAVFDRIDRLYVDHPRGYVLSDWVFPRPAFSEDERRRSDARLMELDIAVESVLTANAALYVVLRRLVASVDALVGHSTGEHSAAMATGVLDVTTDERLATFCHGLHASYADAAARHEVPGAVLLAIGGDAGTVERIAAAAEGELYVAMDNCPHQVVLVGEAEAAARAREIARTAGLVCEQLPYDRAVHTPLFTPFAEDLRAIFGRLPVSGAGGELWSCTTAAPYPADATEVRELLVEHWTSPVRFRETIEALHDDGVRVFVEVGPRGNLTAFVTDILRGRPHCAVAADRPRRSGLTQLGHLLAMLAVHGVDLQLDWLFEERGAHIVDWRSPPPAVPTQPSARVALSTTWPMLTLDEDAATRWREPTSTLPPTPAPASEPVFVAPVAAPVLEPVPAPVLEPVPAPVLEPVPAATTALALNGEADAVLGGHLTTMHRFLDVSADIVQAYLTEPAELVAGPATSPLVGEILSLTPGAELLARRVVDRAEDRYLLDHSLGWTVSRADPELHALTLMPLAMSVELLAQAAACLLPGRVVVAVRDLRAYRWLQFGDEPVVLELHARRLQENDGDHPRVRVELREDCESAAPLVEATVLLGEALPAPPAPAIAPASAQPPRRLRPGSLYGEVMFHGPAWQTVAAVDGIGPSSASGRLVPPPRGGFLRDAPAPEFLIDPVVLDAAGQLVGFWSAEVFEHGRVVFPFGCDEIEVFSAPALEGEPLTAVAAIMPAGDHLLSSDIEVVGADGRCRMRLRGWRDKRFQVPERFEPLTVAARLEPLSEPFPLPPAIDSAWPMSCRRLDSELGADGVLWAQVWASRLLGRRERELFSGLRAPAPRRLEWLAARTAAKEAVIELLASAAGAPGVGPRPAEIEILPDERGAPRVFLAGGRSDLGLTPVVSLAHTRGVAVATVALVPAEAVAIGVDIELLGAERRDLSEVVGSARERSILEGVAPAERAEWELRLWCARESAAKAAGRGLTPGTWPEVVDADMAEGTVRVVVAGRRGRVSTWRDGDVVAALAILWEGDV